jgi:hypothetical protein
MTVLASHPQRDDLRTCRQAGEGAIHTYTPFNLTHQGPGRIILKPPASSVSSILCLIPYLPAVQIYT